jgi:hypothetical protein
MTEKRRALLFVQSIGPPERLRDRLFFARAFGFLHRDRFDAPRVPGHQISTRL